MVRCVFRIDYRDEQGASYRVCRYLSMKHATQDINDHHQACPEGEYRVSYTIEYMEQVLREAAN